MADTNRTELRYIEEVTWGETPAAPTMQELRLTSEDMAYNITTVTSSELRSDRQITDQVLTGADPSGSINFELSYDAYDEFFEGALFESWVGVGGGATEEIISGATVGNLDFSLDSALNTITLGSAVTHAIVAGQHIRLNGSATDDGYHKVEDVSGQILIVEAITTTEILDETDLATIKGARLRNGIETHSYTIERKIDTVVDQYFSWKGMTVNNMSITVGNQSIMTGSFAFIGADESAGTSSIASSVTDATTEDIMSAPANVASLQEGGSSTSLDGVYVQSLDFTVDNGLRGIKDIRSINAQGIGTGTCNVTGNLSLLFENLTIYNKLKNCESSSITFGLEDGTAGQSNCYIVYMPKIKYSTAKVGVGGTNADVTQDMAYQALRHPTYDCTIQICKFDSE